MKRLLDKVIVSKTDNIFIQFFRYFFVGAAATAVDFALYYVFTAYVGVHYLLSGVIGFTGGLTVNYFLSISWVFGDHSDRQRRVALFFMFAVIGVIALGLNSLILYLCTDIYGIHYMLSKVIATGIVFFWNFLGRKLLMANPRITSALTHQTA